MGTLKMRDMKMQDWKMRYKPAGGGKCETGKCGTKLQGWKMQEWKKREKKIIWHHAYRMQNLFVFLGHLQRVTQDTEVEVARVNRGMSIRRPKKKSNLQRRPNKSVHLSL